MLDKASASLYGMKTRFYLLQSHLKEQLHLIRQEVAVQDVQLSRIDSRIENLWMKSPLRENGEKENR